MNGSNEQRILERYDVKAPAVIKHLSDDRETSHHMLLSRDVSSSGAYFYTRAPRFYAGSVQVEILFELLNNEGQTCHFVMTASGEVVRRDLAGVAVHFNDDIQLEPFETH